MGLLSENRTVDSDTYIYILQELLIKNKSGDIKNNGMVYYPGFIHIISHHLY